VAPSEKTAKLAERHRLPARPARSLTAASGLVAPPQSLRALKSGARSPIWLILATKLRISDSAFHSSFPPRVRPSAATWYSVVAPFAISYQWL
jgi:hypothetical protein